MASYSGNADYLTIDAQDVTAHFKSVELEESVEGVDVTAGSDSTHRERNAGIKDNTIDITLTFDIADLQNYIDNIATGLKVIEFGPEGNTSGKPRHVQSFIITSVRAAGGSVEKSERTFVLSGEAALAPTTDMFANGVY